jgi:hypothetical protein
MFRHATGVAVIAGLTASSGYAAWAGQSAAEGRGPEILVEMRMKMSNVQTKEVLNTVTRYVVHSGELPSDMQDSGSPFACTPLLPDELAKSPARESIQARGIPLPSAGQILFDCVIRQDRQVIATPAVLAGDGKTATIETTNGDGSRLIKIEVTGTTSQERIAEARKKSDKR